MTSASAEQIEEEPDSFWGRVHAAEAAFDRGARNRSAGELASALLELDGVIWKGQQDLDDPEFIAQARERFREMVVHLGSLMEASAADRSECLSPLAERMLQLRDRWRKEKKWNDADLIRECHHEAGIIVEDTPEGARWRLQQAHYENT